MSDQLLLRDSSYGPLYASYVAIVLSTSFWGLFYLMLKYYIPSKSGEYHTRVLTVLHGCLTAFVGLNQCFLEEHWPFKHPEWPTSDTQNWLLVTSLGYFIFDLFWCLYYQTETKLMIAHHVYSVFALKVMLFKGFSGAQATCSLGALEITNPLLQMRWFLRTEGYYPSTVFTVVELTFIIMFFLARCVVGSFVLVAIYFHPGSDWNMRILAIVMYLLSWMFMINIVKYFYIKYVKGKILRTDDLETDNTSGGIGVATS